MLGEEQHNPKVRTVCVSSLGERGAVRLWWAPTIAIAAAGLRAPR